MLDCPAIRPFTFCVFCCRVVIDELETAYTLNSLGMMLFHLLREKANLCPWPSYIIELVNVLAIEGLADRLDVLLDAFITG